MDGKAEVERCVGVDVAKARGDVHVRPGGRAFGGTTDPEGSSALVDRLAPLQPRLIVLEARGGYEAVVAALLAEAGPPGAIVNPRQVRKSAGAIGRLAKPVLGPASRTRGTDAIDAGVIAHFAEAIRPAPRPLPDHLGIRLRERLARRRQLVVMIHAERQRLAKARDQIARRSFKALLSSREAERARLDRALDQLIGTSPLGRAQEDLLKSVPGVGDVVARTLIAALPELGQVDRHQIAARAGVAPINRDSGRLRGHRRIQGGRVLVRAPLDVAGLVAIRHDPPLRAFYRRLRAANKPARRALVAVMRKLLTMLNAMVRDGRPWADHAASL